MQPIKVHQWDQPTQIRVEQKNGNWVAVEKNFQYTVNSSFITFPNSSHLKFHPQNNLG